MEKIVNRDSRSKLNNQVEPVGHRKKSNILACSCVSAWSFYFHFFHGEL